MLREEAITVFKAFMENPLFSDVHKAAFNIAIHDINQRHDWDINKLMLVPKTEWEQEPTTKNNLEVDCISREQAKEAIRDKFKDLPSRVEINTILNELPSVTPQEPILDQISEIIEPLRHLPIGEMSDIEWDILRVIDKYKGESEDNGNDD